MEIDGLYQFILLLVLVGLIAGVGVLVLDKFAATTGLTESAKSTLYNASGAIGDIPKTWMTLIVTIGVLSIVIIMVVRSFGGMAGSR